MSGFGIRHKPPHIGGDRKQPRVSSSTLFFTPIPCMCNAFWIKISTKWRRSWAAHILHPQTLVNLPPLTLKLHCALISDEWWLVWIDIDLSPTTWASHCRTHTLSFAPQMSRWQKHLAYEAALCFPYYIKAALISFSSIQMLSLMPLTFWKWFCLIYLDTK